MSKKRTSAKFNDDEQTDEASDEFQQEVKRAKLDPCSNTTLADLPNELLFDILANAVVTEVKDMKLAKSVWKEKADLVISRLGTVCSLWSDILSTNFLRNKVHGILHDSPQEKFRLEVLHQSAVALFVSQVALMNDEVFMLCRPEDQESFINVHDRNNIGEVKCVIPLQGLHPVGMTATCASNRVYVLSKDPRCYSVSRITKDGVNHQFKLSKWVEDLDASCSQKRLFVAFDSGLIILSCKESPDPSVIGIYDENGSLQHEITLFPAAYGFSCIIGIFQKSTGNLVLATRPASNIFSTVLMEIDTTGRIIRQYCSSMSLFSGVNVADAHGRFWISNVGGQAEVLDSELNLLDKTDRPNGMGWMFLFYGTHYNSERNETASLHTSLGFGSHATTLTIFRFTGE